MDGMDTPSPLILAAMILHAPGWCRIGITAPDERMREEAALELGAFLIDRMIDAPPVIVPEGQMALPL